MTSRRRRTKRPALLATFGAAAAITALFLSQIPSAQSPIARIPEEKIDALEAELLVHSIPCPDVGYTCIPSDITIGYDAATPAGFGGVVTAGDPACVGGREVDLFHGAGPFVTPEETTTTAPDGSWHIDVAVPPDEGTWTARAAGEPAGGYETSLFCEEASDSVTIMHGENVIAFFFNGEPFGMNIGGDNEGSDTGEVCREDRQVTIYDSSDNEVASGVVDKSGRLVVTSLISGETYTAVMDAVMRDNVYCTEQERDHNVGSAITTTLGSLSYQSSNQTWSISVDNGACRISVRVARLQEADDGQSNWTEVATDDSGGGGNYSITYTKQAGKDYRVFFHPYLLNTTTDAYCTNATSNVVP